MPRKKIRTYGMFKGLPIYEEHRGKYVLVVNGKVVAFSDSPNELLRDAPKTEEPPLILGIPQSEAVLAATLLE